MKAGSLLSAVALLATFTFQTVTQYVQQNGGTYPSYAIMLGALSLLTLGSALSYYGARLLHTTIGLVVPLVGVAVISTWFIYWTWCAYYCVAP